MRYPYELNLVGDAKTTLQALIPLLQRKADRSLARGDREQRRATGGTTVEREAMTDADPVNPMRIFYELSARLPDERHRRGRLRQRGQLVRPPPAASRGDVRGSLSGHAGHDGTRRPVRDRREVGAPGPAGDRASSVTARCR